MLSMAQPLNGRGIRNFPGGILMLKGLTFRRAFGRTMGALAILWIAGFLTTGHAYGQSVTQISGIVKDETGAAAPGAEVTATQTETGFKRSATTDDAGVYVLTNLPLGPYRLEVTK